MLSKFKIYSVICYEILKAVAMNLKQIYTYPINFTKFSACRSFRLHFELFCMIYLWDRMTGNQSIAFAFFFFSIIMIIIRVYYYCNNVLEVLNNAYLVSLVRLKTRLICLTCSSKKGKICRNRMLQQTNVCHYYRERIFRFAELLRLCKMLYCMSSWSQWKRFTK